MSNVGTPTQSTTVEGEFSPQFEALRSELQRMLDSGEELGASLAVVDHGKPVVDLWGGWREPEHQSLWQRDTIVNVWSITKTMTTLSALMLADRGLLDLDAPVAKYWPEFAQNGKAEITVKQVMSHTGGVSGWEMPFTLEQLYDYEQATSHLAAQAPWWEPGTASGYSLLNFGHIVGEIVRRVSGKTLKAFVAEEIAGPLGADFTIGVPKSAYDRVSNVVPPPPAPIDLSQLPPDHPAIKTFSPVPMDATVTYTDAWREAEIGAANGFGNARSVARIQSVITNGGEVDGVRLLSQKTIDRIFEVQSDGMDLVLFQPVRFGIGYGLPSQQESQLPDRRIAYWGGWGGSIVLNDVDRGFTFAYVMNRMDGEVLGSARSAAYQRAFLDAIT
jgi:CubicO group peptidase (beta-lactamase class C family)